MASDTADTDAGGAASIGEVVVTADELRCRFDLDFLAGVGVEVGGRGVVAGRVLRYSWSHANGFQFRVVYKGGGGRAKYEMWDMEQLRNGAQKFVELGLTPLRITIVN